MPLFDQVVAEMQRRVTLLPKEVQAWKASADANVKGLGIHRSQFEALKIMMDGLLEKQDKLLPQLLPALPLEQFAGVYWRLVNQTSGINNLWSIFRYIIAQHQDELLKSFLDAADLVAADCYLICLNQARKWGLIKEEEFREPPLAYLEAEISPATASRGTKVEALGFPLRQYRDLRLPIPIVLLPFDHIESPWLFCSLHHEVGHNLDQDLKLRSELKEQVYKRLQAENVPLDRREIWEQWVSEVLADAFGVLLGGAGFGHSLASLLLVLAPLFPALNPKDKHPDHYVRVYLVSAMLRQCGVPKLTEAADLIMQKCNAYQKPAWINPYVKDTGIVAEVFLSQPLNALGNRALRELVPDLAGDVERASSLAPFLRTGFKREPDPKQLPPFSHRLVPVAAQLALVKIDNPTTENLNRIQERSFQYLRDIPRPEYLAGVDRREFLRTLTRELDFNLEVIV